MKGKEYISMTLLFSRANIISTQKIKSHAAITRFANVYGFLVDISSPANKD
jgi:hypothetical protein